MKERVATIDYTSSILMKHSINPKARYGQNFMINDKIPSLISSNSSINENSLVIEIGPGVGALTQFLLEKAKKVIAIEIDTNLANILKDTLKDYLNLEVINTDFLKYDLDSINYGEFDNIVFVSNLPYYITSEILIKLLKFEQKFDIIAMMQKEVANRILKKEDINDLVLYSSILSEVSKISDVSKNDFFPRPNIDSCVLKLSKISFNNVLGLEKIINCLFKQRRKTIYNNLKYINENIKMDEKYLLNVLKTNNLTINSRIDELKIDKIIEFILFLLKELYLECNAKINIGLKITGKEDNMHNFKSIYAPISLYDYILVYPIDNERDIIASNIEIKNNNLEKVLKILNLDTHYYIELTKNIPIGSGLGGGSSDAYFLAKKLSNLAENLPNLTLSIGQDTVFYHYNKPSEIVNFIDFIDTKLELNGYYALLICDNNKISTKDCFDKYDSQEFNCKYDYGKEYFKDYENDLIGPAILLNPSIKDELENLKQYDFDYISMSGSGNCVYGLSKNYKYLYNIWSNLRDKYDFVKIVRIL